ncbi:MAG TPA: phage tail assembly protein [Allosphingosinicella sp.]
MSAGAPVGARAPRFISDTAEGVTFGSAAGTTYELKHPIAVTINPGRDDERTEEIREVQLRRLTGKDLREIDRATGDVDGALRMISRMTGLTIAQVDAMDAEDIAALGDKAAAFTPPGRKTGGTSSAT